MGLSMWLLGLPHKLGSKKEEVEGDSRLKAEHHFYRILWVKAVFDPAQNQGSGKIDMPFRERSDKAFLANFDLPHWHRTLDK